MYRILFLTTLFVLPLFIPVIKLINNTSDALITKVILYALFIFFSIIFSKVYNFFCISYTFHEIFDTIIT